MTSPDNAKTLLVQGWTGINHSYAMVNQYQLLALSVISGLSLYTQEMPLFDTRWSKSVNDSGFSLAEQDVISKIPTYLNQPVSAIYRIHTNNSLALVPCTVITFLVTEFGLDARGFTADASIDAYNKNGGLVVTPSHWSRDRIIDFGFDPQNIFIIPHGVDQTKFFPFAPGEILAARAALGYSPDDVVFLNVGAPIWNKGMDIVIEAFFKLRQTHKNARLLIKDQQALYGLSAIDMIRNLASSGKIQVDNDSVESIRILPQTLDIGQLRSLYNLADYYLSPYRAEGFNLPVIEAIACGIKAIVTEGGSTDDFCNDFNSVKIPSQKHLNTKINETHIGAYLQPDADALLIIMQQCAQNGRANDVNFQFGRTNMLELFTWSRAAKLIGSLIPA